MGSVTSVATAGNDRKVLVLAAGGSFGSTWEYGQSGAWTDRATASPVIGFGGAGMGYDSVRKQTLLFGAEPGGRETWLWDGAAWTHVTSATVALAGARDALAFDTARGQAIFYGSASNQTWIWNCTSWSEPIENHPIMTIDMATKPDGTWNYTTIDIPFGVEVRFKRNDANTPVVWLASGQVSIAGVLNLDGADANGQIERGTETRGGPGGFASGLGGTAIRHQRCV